MLNLVLNSAKKGVPVYLYGPPGSGKSYLARKVAEILELESKEINAHEYMTLSDILGFNSAIDGKWIDTGFQKLYANGGLLIVDEYDNLPTSTQVGFNGVLDSSFLEFDNKLVRRSENFLVICTGNTAGKGATAEFPSRNPIDKSTLNRMVSFFINYDKEAELTMFGKVAEYCHQIREYSSSHKLGVLVTIRNMKMMSALLPLEEPSTTLKSIFTKGVLEDQLEKSTIEFMTTLYEKMFSTEQVSAPAQNEQSNLVGDDLTSLYNFLVEKYGKEVGNLIKENRFLAVINLCCSDTQFRMHHTVYGGKYGRKELADVIESVLIALDSLYSKETSQARLRERAKINRILFTKGFRYINESGGSF